MWCDDYWYTSYIRYYWCPQFTPCFHFPASHNPKVSHGIHKRSIWLGDLRTPQQDNGYKVFTGDTLSSLVPPLVHAIQGLLGKCGTGLPCPVDVFCRFLISSQIIEPHDSGISGSILLNLVPDEGLWNPETLLGSSNCVDRTEELTQAYFEYISELQTKCVQDISHEAEIAYRPHQRPLFITTYQIREYFYAWCLLTIHKEGDAGFRVS